MNRENAALREDEQFLEVANNMALLDLPVTDRNERYSVASRRIVAANHDYLVLNYSGYPNIALPSTTDKTAAFEADEISQTELMRRIFEVTIASAALVILSPLILVTAILIKLTSPGPVLFSQERLTKGGKTFQLYKFRSMREDAEDATGAVWAVTNDPRVTPIGAFLRKSRIDEIPQLMNVLAGDMSLVGPRPERPEFADLLRKKFRRFDDRLRVRAGITGLAQVCRGYAGSLETYRSKLALDKMYIRKRSLALDCWILLRTVNVILTGSGAR